MTHGLFGLFVKCCRISLTWQKSVKIIHIFISYLDLTLSESLGRGRSGYEISQIYDVRDVMVKSDEDNETYLLC